jgi:outer membrane protein assembly factor BamD (BamD/ComL family)
MWNNSKTFLTLFFMMTSVSVWAADSSLSKLENADSLYQNGDCEKAIPLYNALSSSELKPAEKDRVVFRTAYCHFSLGNYSDSENGFKKYLSTHPNEEEAMLKYSQSLLYQDKYSDAENAAKKINSTNFKTDAAIVIARAEIETDNASKALTTLKPYLNNAEALYWTGVANYNSDRDKEAEQNFKMAAQKADKESWVINDSNGWVTRINQEKRKFHLRLTAGILKDTNIDQSGSSGTVEQGPSGPGSSKAAYGNTNYTADSGQYASVDIIHNSYTSRKLSLTTTVNATSPFYKSNPLYNQETLSLDFSLKAIQSSTLNYGASFKYLDTFYHRVYSQDYVYITPFVSWSFASNYWFKFSIPVTSYLNNKQIKLFSGNADLYYDPTNWVSLSVGASYTKSSAPDPVLFDQGPSLGPKLISGTLSSHYNSKGGYVGATFYIGDTVSFGATGSYYVTNYTLEQFFASQGKKAREDKLKSYQLSLTKSFIQNVLSATLSHSYTDNKSDGFPGLISGQTVTNNTYTRGYSLLSMEYYY